MSEARHMTEGWPPPTLARSTPAHGATKRPHSRAAPDTEWRSRLSSLSSSSTRVLASSIALSVHSASACTTFCGSGTNMERGSSGKRRQQREHIRSESVACESNGSRAIQQAAHRRDAAGAPIDWAAAAHMKSQRAADGARLCGPQRTWYTSSQLRRRRFRYSSRCLHSSRRSAAAAADGQQHRGLHTPGIAGNAWPQQIHCRGFHPASSAAQCAHRIWAASPSARPASRSFRTARSASWSRARSWLVRTRTCGQAET